MKVRLTTGSRYNPNTYAWYLSGFDGYSQVNAPQRALRLHVYGPRRDAGFGLQPIQPTAGANWSFWRTGLVVPSLVFGFVTLGLGLLLLEVGVGLFKGAVLALWALHAGTVLTSPLLCFLTLTALRVTYRVLHTQGGLGALPWPGRWVPAQWGSLASVVVVALAPIGLSGLFGAKQPRVAVPSASWSAGAFSASRWESAHPSSSDWARVTRKAHELNTWGWATPVIPGRPASRLEVGIAPLFGLGQITTQVRPVGVSSLPHGSAWPSLSAQLVNRVTSIRALSSSWYFFLEALSNQGTRFNSTSAMRPHQFSGALRALHEYRAQSQLPLPPLTLSPSSLSQGTLPLTLSQGAAAESRGRLLQPADWLLKAKPWSRV